MRRPVFYIKLEFVRVGELEVISERIVDIKNYRFYFETYEQAQTYLEAFVDPLRASYGPCVYHEYSINKVWIDEDA